MAMRRMAMVGVVAVLGLALAACGDDEEALSEEEFLEQGNAICAEGSEELDEAATELFGEEEPSEDQVSEFADTFEENIGNQIDEIDDLSGPDDLEEALDPVLDDARDVLEEFAQAIRDDPESVFASEEDPFADINPQMVEIGLTECAE